MMINLISYGDEKYEIQKQFFNDTALASSFFDKITIYGTKDIDKLFYTQFQTLLEHKRGGGYWVWKLHFIKKALDNLPVDDVLIYCDAGCMINKYGKQRFQEYIHLLDESTNGNLAFELPHREIEYTKKEVFDYFPPSIEIINSKQLMATVILLKKCVHSDNLVQRWLDILYDSPLLFADDKNVKNQYKDFIDHRHDQSIFSIIRKTYGSTIIPDETYFQDFIREGLDYPFWATRLF